MQTAKGDGLIASVIATRLPRNWGRSLQHLGAADLSDTAERLFTGLRTEGETNLLGLIQTYALYGKPIPESLQTRYQELDLSEATDSLEAEVVKRISEEGLLPDARSSAFYKRFEFDLASKPARINIELDGRHHTAGFYRVRDALRDKFIEGFRWRVLRVKVRYAMSTDEIVGRVRAALAATPVAEVGVMPRRQPPRILADASSR